MLLIIFTVEGIGYIGRLMSHSDPKSLGPYVMQTLLLLVAPAYLCSLSEHSSKPKSDIDFYKAAAIYVVLGRIIRMLHAERFSLIRINWLTKFFVLGDVLSFLLQSGGQPTLYSRRTNADATQVEASWQAPMITT